MARRLLICTEFSPEELRRLSREEPDRRAALRMLAIANGIEGMSRAEAARLADMSDQACPLRVIATGESGGSRPGLPIHCDQ